MEAGKLVGVLGFVIFGEIEAKIGALEEIWELQPFGFLLLHLPLLSHVIYGYTFTLYLCFYIDYE